MTGQHGAWFSAIVAATMVTLSAQTPKPAFEVTSVRKNISGSLSYGGSLEFQGGRVYTGTNVPLRMLLLRLYGLRDEQLVGAPEWIATERFDISGRTDRDVPREQLVLMIQSLIEDRFKLRFVKETRQVDIYTMTAARADGRLGPNLYRRSDDECKKALDNRAIGFPNVNLPKPAGGLRSTMGNVCVPMGEIAAAIGRDLRTDVIDKTGLNGLWDYILALRRRRAVSDETEIDPLEGPPILVAVPEQLGLKLQRIRGSVQVLRVTSIEQPTVN